MSNSPSPNAFTSRVRQLFIWLSGASVDALEQCPKWEQRRYVAFGATVLVPTIFALIAASYAVWTLNKNVLVVVPIALAWAFIILSIDRAMLVTYRSFQPKKQRLKQFGLRFMLAMLMGLTISHPLALLLFKDKISAQIEHQRGEEIQETRELVTQNIQEVENKITANETALAEQRAELQSTFETKFLDQQAQMGPASLDAVGLDPETKAAMDARIKAEIDPLRERITQVDAQMESTNAEYAELKEEIDHWQREFEREINGQRSGIVGVGPRAKSIRDDQLEWRKAEAKRLANSMEFLTSQRNELSAAITDTDRSIRDEYNDAAAARVAEAKAERERVAAMKLQAKEAQMGEFLEQQVTVRSGIQNQIDAGLSERARLQEEVQLISAAGNERITELKEEPRRDLLTQTLALHELFLSGSEGGMFALSAYIVLTLLFLTVDTIPLVIKFFATPGPYDNVVKLNEERYACSANTQDYGLEIGIDPKLIMFELNSLGDKSLGIGDLLTRKASFERYMDLERSLLANMPESERAIREKTLDNIENRFNYTLEAIMWARLKDVEREATGGVPHPNTFATNGNGHANPQLTNGHQQQPQVTNGNGAPHTNGNGNGYPHENGGANGRYQHPQPATPQPQAQPQQQQYPQQGYPQQQAPQPRQQVVANPVKPVDPTQAPTSQVQPITPPPSRNNGNEGRG